MPERWLEHPIDHMMAGSETSDFRAPGLITLKPVSEVLFRHRLVNRISLP
ncbi:MAG: hypothetical protein K9I85_12965 [Saprospiraceae bacterium]|nr:hypothetical protein [Saprospiraceae bacterium]